MTANNEVVIIDGARTAIGNFGGALKDVTAPELGAAAATGVLDKTGIDPTLVKEFIMSNARQAGVGPNPARLAQCRTLIPLTAPANTPQQACVGGLRAVIQGYHSIVMGDADVVLAGGMESLSNVPYLSMTTRWGARMGETKLLDGLHRDGFVCGIESKFMGELCDALAIERGVTRDQQDEFAVQSNKKAAKGIASGFFARQIVPVPVKSPKGPATFEVDEHVREDASMEGLAKLRPGFLKEGRITAGNASGVCDGAAALLLTSDKRAEELGLKPMAVIRSYGMAALPSTHFPVAPVPATRQALQRAGLKEKDIDLVEANEAFAAQVLMCMQELDFDPAIVNVYGGAVALGHPIGMSGSRIVMNLMYALRERGKRYGLANICGNGGHGMAMVIEMI